MAENYKRTFHKGKMNKDIDERMLPQGEYRHAENIRITNTDGSDAGAIEKALGNTIRTNVPDATCIGAVGSEGLDKIYWCAVGSNGESYIHEYDIRTSAAENILTDTRTGSDQVLNFSKDFPITGINIITNPENDEVLLAITDGLNLNPRLINVNRAKGYGENNFTHEDIDLIKNPPKQGPKVDFTNTPTLDENDVKERFFAFAYRYKYLDGEFSAPSPFSKYMFSPYPFDLDFETMQNLGMVNAFNSFNIVFNSGDERVTDVQLLFKNPESENIYLIETINKAESQYLDNTEQSFFFSSNKTYSALPTDEIYRLFDNVPLKPKAQEFIGNRLVYGNYYQGYDIKDAEDGNVISVNFKASLKSNSLLGSSIIPTYSANFQEVSINLTGQELKEGGSLALEFSLESQEQTDSALNPATFFGGTYEGAMIIPIKEDFSTLTDWLDSNSFQNAIDSINNNFAALVETVVPSDNMAITYGDFSFTASGNILTVNTPVITYTTSGSPRTEQFTFLQEEGVGVYFRDFISPESLKSNRSYEVGVAYIDKNGRYTTVLTPSLDLGRPQNEVFVPISRTNSLNKIEVEIENKAPYFADRYRFFIKESKLDYHTIYATIFYEDGLYRWIYLMGANKDKVKESDTLIVKSDGDGVLDSVIKTRVLEVSQKKMVRNSAGEPQGWLDSNVDFNGEDIIEIEGLFAKIKPVGFKMDFNPLNFIEHFGRGYVKSLRRGYASCQIPSANSDESLVGFKDTNVFEDLVIGSGSVVRWYIYFWEKTFGKRRNERNYSVGIDNLKVSSRTYEADSPITDNSQGAFEKFLNGDLANDWEFHSDPKDQLFYEAGGFVAYSRGYYRARDESLGFDLRFMRVKTGYLNNSRKTFLFIRQYDEHTNRTTSATLKTKLTLQLVNQTLIFETEAKDNPSEVFYECPQTFEIESGYHKGNIQDQSANQNAKASLDFFNCYAFDNGVESYRVRDEFNANYLNAQSRPNAVLLDGYKRKHRKTSLTFGGGLEESTSYNALNEFNISRGNFKDMDAKYDAIKRLYARENDLLVFQEDKVFKVLYGKNVLYNADGTANVSSVEQVLGQEVAFVEEVGIGNQPVSMAHYGRQVYFTDAPKGKVLRLSQNGISPISDFGMRSYFKKALYEARNRQVLGGYDNNNEQYVLFIGDVDGQQSNLVVDCSSRISRRLAVNETFTYELYAGTRTGDVTLNYVISSGTLDIETTYNGVSATYTDVGGSGSITINKDSASETNITIAVTGLSNAAFEITNLCPVPENMEVVLIVVNREGVAGQSMTNRYKHGNFNYQSFVDVFLESGTTRVQSIEGEIGTFAVPQDGSLVRVSAFSSFINNDSFTGCNVLGYLVSNAAGLTTANVLQQATYPALTKSTVDGEEDNYIEFTFNKATPTDKLYLIWDYRGEPPVLVDDIVTGISNGGSAIINVAQNDTLPSSYTLTIETSPTNGTAAVNGDNTITYTHTAGQSLDDSFVYKIETATGCSATATVTTEALAITNDTYIYIYFDSSGSMNSSLTPLQTMRDTLLKDAIKDAYATGGTESEGNTDTATNGSDEYDNHVTIIQNNTERTLHMLNNEATSFPTGASNVIMLVFQDESGPYGAEATFNGARTTTYDQDLAALRTSVIGHNTQDNNFYRAVIFQVDGYAGFKSFLQSVENGTGNFTGTNGLSDLSTNFGFNYDITDGGTAQYYLTQITTALQNLGFNI